MWPHGRAKDFFWAVDPCFRPLLFAGFFSAHVMWGEVIAGGRSGRDIAAAPRLRFPPLEIFAQRQF